MSALHPRQQYMRGKAPRPAGMARVILPYDQREVIEELCLGVFATMTNNGASLTDVLTAIYLTGAENALAARREA